MDWKTLGKNIAKVGAPILGTAVGGPLGGAAAGALVAGIFGASADDPAAIAQAIAGDPQAAVKLRELELAHKIDLEKLILDETKAYLADRQDARAREVATTQATGKRDTPLYVLAGVVVTGFFVLCAVLMYVPIPDGQGSAVLLLFGGLVSGFSTVLAYFFGSSKGSADKNTILAATNRPGRG
ncbi:MAG: hypothetical protein QMD09_04165 [Desulfatibacillaceae bacterium]|nr:hypothetical protein [Desulfatibacillaceae bacterium]